MHKPDLSAADQCVMCGMCQPHCPTYAVNHIESESPRGRLAMILGISKGDLTPDISITKHLNNCTGCGACEAMCPSRVPYMQLIDDAKQLTQSISKQSIALKTLLLLTRHPARYSLLDKILRGKHLGNLLRTFNLLKKDTTSLQNAIQTTAARTSLQAFNHAKGEVLGNIGLFTGCITQLFDHKTLTDTITLLTHCGYNVHTPSQQVCCGALHQHNAQPNVAQQLNKQNQSVFKTKTLDAIISTSTGCTTQLATQLHDINIFDIMQFIDEKQLLKTLKLKSVKNKIAVHEPCSQRNQLKLKTITPLLNQIPDTDIDDLANNQLCCGAGGANLITQNTASIQLKQLKVDAINTLSPDILVTTNYGCALHIASGLQTDTNLSQNKQIEILHPVSLLVRSASLK